LSEAHRSRRGIELPEVKSAHWLTGKLRAVVVVQLQRRGELMYLAFTLE
jgi:hypothetical protein